MTASTTPWTCAPPSLAAQAVSTPAVLPLLEELDLVDRNSSGALLYGAAGLICVERGQVCWAVAGDMRTRLTDILCHQAPGPVSRRQVESIYRACQKTRKPLGQELVARGLVTDASLRMALRQHNAEALALMSASGPARTEWRPHRKRGYDPRYAFSFAETLVSVAALRQPDQAREAAEILERVLLPGTLGVAFRREGSRSLPMPIAQRGAERLGVREVLDLGSWATGLADLCGALDEGPAVAGGRWCGRCAALSWREGDVLFVALCSDRAAFACLLSRLSLVVPRAALPPPSGPESHAPPTRRRAPAEPGQARTALPA